MSPGPQHILCHHTTAANKMDFVGNSEFCPPLRKSGYTAQLICIFSI